MHEQSTCSIHVHVPTSLYKTSAMNDSLALGKDTVVHILYSVDCYSLSLMPVWDWQQAGLRADTLRRCPSGRIAAAQCESSVRHVALKRARSKPHRELELKGFVGRNMHRR